MKLKLVNSDQIDLNSKEELARVIPSELKGRVLNYGQGEGQVEIENSVWGFYSDSDDCYCMVFEEGAIDWARLKVIVELIATKISTEFNTKINIISEGSLNCELNT